MQLGSLTVVGTGIKVITQITSETLSRIEKADKVFFLVADPATAIWLTKINPQSESLDQYYKINKDRKIIYSQMVERVISSVREGLNVCFVSYGHPGVFAEPCHEAIRVARSEGYQATMLPAISSLDCLYADIGVDPGTYGCQIFEATDFLIYQRKFDCSTALILLQVGVIGERTFKEHIDLKNLHILVDFLEKYYDSNHEVTIYEAAQYPFCKPVINTICLRKVVEAPVTPISTIYIPPKPSSPPDVKMLEMLNISYFR